MFPVYSVWMTNVAGRTIANGGCHHQLSPSTRASARRGTTTWLAPPRGRHDATAGARETKSAKERGHRSEIHRALMYSVAPLGDVTATGPNVNQLTHTRSLSRGAVFASQRSSLLSAVRNSVPSFLPPSPLRTYTLSLKLMNWVIRGNGYAITLVIIICFTPPPPLPPFGRSASLFRHQYLRTPLHVRGSRPTMHGTLGSFWGSASMLGLYNRIPLRRRN